MKEKKVKKIVIILFIALLTVQVSLPIAWADDLVTPTPSDTPVPTAVQQTAVDNTATVTNSMDSSANTGDNSVNPTPTDAPTPIPSDTPTPTTDPLLTPTPTEDQPLITPDPTMQSVDASNAAAITNDITASSNTGANTTTTTGDTTNSTENASPTPTPPPSQIVVQTGDGVSIVAGSNTINTTTINADVSHQTINIFGDQTGDIDLSTLFQLVNAIISQGSNTDPVINVQITGVNNYAYLSNTALSTANTGGNTVNGSSNNVIVSTGNAQSLVSLINQVNLTVVNSSLHMVSINIFGHLSGNIILPNLSPFQSSTCSGCGVSFNTQNQANVVNTIESDANTGENTETASSTAQLTTGNAQSRVNTVNIVNQTLLGVLFENLFINDFGMWNGSFLGWDTFSPQQSGTLALSSSIPLQANGQDTTLSSTTITNNASVTNTIFSLANTGRNTLSGQNVIASTGNAYSAVSLVNLINSNFFRTVVFFGFVNIFGQWDGNIGGADAFVTPTPSQQPTTESQSTNHKEDGGVLEVANSNNVGIYVLPGDTVTFFLKAKNIGKGKVYHAVLHLSLFHNNQQVGEIPFELGDIPVGRGVAITTGLVLSETAEPGEYTATATVTGTTGDEDTQLSAHADSTFSIFGTGTFVLGESSPNTPQDVPVKQTLGAITPPPPSTNYFLWAVALFMSYLLVRVYRENQRLIPIFAIHTSLKERLSHIRRFFY